MELKVSVSEALALIKEIESVPARLFEYIGMSIQKEVGTFLSNLMGKELTDHIGREKYERKEGATDYRNGSYIRTFCIKGIGDVEVRVPRDRDGLFIDGVIFRMRIGKSIERVPILVAIGVREDGTKLVLGLQSGDKESAAVWRQLFKDLKGRGFDGSTVSLGIMDGLSGLEKVFEEEFSHARVQRCQVHVARNVIAKVPGKLKQQVADDLRSIFYASSRKKADEFAVNFAAKWEKDLPSAVRCLANSLDVCMTFFSFPEEERISLLTTNIIERLNKEFKRRTKPMEIVAGENACYLLLAFISLKMELARRNNKIGKVRPNLPLYQKLHN